MQGIPYRFKSPNQAIQVLNQFKFVEITNGHSSIRVHLNAQGPRVSIDGANPFEVPSVEAFLTNYMELGYRQYLKRTFPLRLITTYGTSREVLGRGTFGSVTQTRRDTPITFPGYPEMQQFAIKTLRNEDNLIDPETIREISSLQILVHPNIVPLIDVKITPNQTHLIMPVALGTLPYGQMGTNIEPRLFDPRYYRFYIYQLIRGLAYMHMLDVWHRDIKPENILVFSNPHIDGYILKYADFGISRNLTCTEADEESTPLVYSLWYRPPEILLGGETTDSSDVWALGITLLQLVLRRPLLPGSTEVEQLNRIFEFVGSPNQASPLRKYSGWHRSFGIYDRPVLASLRPQFEGLPDGIELYQMISRMLDPDPDNRVSAITLVSAGYFDPIRSQVDDNPVFWAPIPMVLSCKQILVTLDDFKRLPLTETMQSQRRFMVMQIFRYWETMRLYWKTFFVAVAFLDWYLHYHPDPVALPALVAMGCLLLAEDTAQSRMHSRKNYVDITGFRWSQLGQMEIELLRTLVNHLVTITSYDYYQIERGNFTDQVQDLARALLFILSLTRLALTINPRHLNQIAFAIATQVYRQRAAWDIQNHRDVIRDELMALESNDITAFLEQQTHLPLSAIIDTI
jgi:serine/threonine protein kinase